MGCAKSVPTHPEPSETPLQQQDAEQQEQCKIEFNQLTKKHPWHRKQILEHHGGKYPTRDQLRVWCSRHIRGSSWLSFSDDMSFEQVH